MATGLPLHRPGEELGAPRARRHPARQRDPHPPPRPRPRVGGRARTRLRPQHRTRRVPHHRRRCELGAGAVPRRAHRSRRPRPRPPQPHRPLREPVAGAPQLLGALERRTGKRPVALRRRRRDVDPDHPQPRPPRLGHAGQDRGHRLARAIGAGCGALVESDAAPGLYRSEDFGETWTLASDRQELRYRPWYYMHVFADPQDEDTVYVNNLRMWKSTDAGAHFTQVPTPHGDNHDLWIDPSDNRRMIQSNDGGANVSFNAGASWSSVHNQLTAQLYTVDTDARAPALLRLRHPAGQLQHRSAVGHQRRRHRVGGLPHRRHRGERLRRGGPEGSGRRLRRRHRKLAGRRRGAAALRPPHRAGTARQRVARAPRGNGAGRAQVPIRLDLPDPVLAARPERALRRRQPAVPQHRRRTELGAHQPRSHPRGGGQARSLRAAPSPATRAGPSTTAPCTPSPNPPTSRECCGQGPTTVWCTGAGTVGGAGAT